MQPQRSRDPQEAEIADRLRVRRCRLAGWVALATLLALAHTLPPGSVEPNVELRGVSNAQSLPMSRSV